MHRAHALCLAMAAGVSLLCSGSALACPIPIPIPWFCADEPVAYAPVRVPVQDPTAGPVWTSNGWVYLDAPRYADAPLDWPDDARWREDRGVESVGPGPEGPTKLK